jgi:histidinol-phosphatase
MATGDDDDLTLALKLADAADAITLARHRAGNLVVETKPDLTPVTDADRAVELALRERIERLRPQDEVIGEEFGGSDTDGPAPRAWIIDPIDGTKSFVRGMPTWSTLIALRENGVITVGVVSMPALGRRWWARRGGGAYAQGERMEVSRIAELSEAHLAWSGIEDWDAVGRPDAIVALARACWRSRGIGDAWQYMLVAEGAAEIALDPEAKLWDLAAVKVIVEEAGGRFTSLAGADTAGGGSGIATNGLLHDAALAIVGT